MDRARRRTECQPHDRLDRVHVGGDQDGPVPGAARSSGRGPPAPARPRRRDSPRPAGPRRSSASQASSSAGHRSVTSSRLRPSHSPNAGLGEAVVDLHLEPSRSAVACAVSRQRRIGELTTATTSPRAAIDRSRRPRLRPARLGERRVGATATAEDPGDGVSGLAVAQQDQGRRRPEIGRPPDDAVARRRRPRPAARSRPRRRPAPRPPPAAARRRRRPSAQRCRLGPTDRRARR